MNVIIRAARPDDAPGIVDLARESYERELHPFLIITQPGAVTYLRVLVEFSTRLPDRQFVLAESEKGDLLGFAEFRTTILHQWHLSYIFVATRARRQGIATKLIRQGMTPKALVESLRLNVFAHNAPAIALYEKLGFVPVEEAVWWQARVGTTDFARPLDLTFDDLPAAVATFERYGFCQLSGVFGGTPFQVGRTSGAVLRCFSNEDFGNSELLSSIASLFPAVRSAMAILPAAVTGVPSSARALVRSVEMEWLS